MRTLTLADVTNESLRPHMRMPICRVKATIARARATVANTKTTIHHIIEQRVAVALNWHVTLPRDDMSFLRQWPSCGTTIDNIIDGGSGSGHK